jgi:hypothetical protein
MKIRQMDYVALTHDLTEHGLKTGDVGVVLHCYRGGESFDVEFLHVGQRIIEVTLTTDDIRPVPGPTPAE